MLHLFLACSEPAPPPPAVRPSERQATQVEPEPALTWLDGRRVCDLGVDRLIGDDGAYEASGLTLHDGRLFVAFDNSGRILSLAPDLTSATLAPPVDADDFEAITSAGANLFIAEEDGTIVTWRDEAVTGRAPVAVTMKKGKGIEGLAWAGCQETLLALCEGGCDGGGPLVALRLEGASWSATSIPLPVDFKDYAGLALHSTEACPSDYTLAVLSQKSSALWIGTLSHADGAWTVGAGETLPLPRDAAGKKIYTTAEGVVFLAADRLAVVTDAEDDQPPCGPLARPPTDARHADQAVHIFQR